MTAKEALGILFASYYYDGNYHDVIEAREKLGQSLDRLEKLEKVIEILKRFHFKLNETNHNNTGYEIWTDSLLETQEITQEEYELLKEVLQEYETK